MENIVKRIIFINENINSIENQKLLEILKGGIQNAKFYPVESIEEAFDLIRNKKEEIIFKNGNKKETKVFQYRLFYTIINGSLSDQFFKEYIKATKELTIISANIIFCNDEKNYKLNAYYLDDFLNPGKVYNEKSIDKIIDYINKDENNFLNDSYLLKNKKLYEPLKRSYGNVFFNANNISDIAYPFFFGQIINSTLINEYDLDVFQRFLLDYYPELKDLIIPSREKKISIPYYLLAKFYLHMYTYEQFHFFKNMNLDLTNDKFDIYRIYIFLLYDALNKKSIKSYSKNVYRGTVLSKKEYDDLETSLQYNEEINKNKKIKKEINACLYNCKMFLSFSKSLNIATRFINGGNKDLIPVLFEVEGLNEKDIENNDFFISNLDLENINEYNDEKEVLFLPFSCFEIISIKDEIIENFGEKINVKRITLNYLFKYKDSLYKYIEGIKEKDKFEKFLKEVINSAFSNEITELINFKEFNIEKEFQKFLFQNFINLQNLMKQTGFKLLLIYLSFLGIVFPGLLALGYGFRKLLFNKEKSKHLTFYSNCLYNQYIPKKFREYCIPTLSWDGVSEKAKSFTIELIEDGCRKWLIINIKKMIREINNDNYLEVGETIVDYKGISKNPYKATFILYELKKDNFKPEDWGEGENVEKNYIEKLSKYFTQVVTLDVF